MREYSTPMTVEVPTTGNLTDAVVRNAAEAPDTVVMSRPDGAGDWTDVTAASFHDQVRAVAKGLIAAGIEPGDRVALMSKTRFEWTLLDY
ncbi:MAG: AMP-binding protein, partial [Actinomycetota bacterium]|nr:AMP-binding protein [Actinomycetota bacterium]